MVSRKDSFVSLANCDADCVTAERTSRYRSESGFAVQVRRPGDPWHATCLETGSPTKRRAGGVPVRHAHKWFRFRLGRKLVIITCLLAWLAAIFTPPCCATDLLGVPSDG